MEGWIKLHRKLTDWEWFTDGDMLKLFLFLILKANHEDKNWKGIEIKRGQLVTGLESLSEATGTPVKKLRLRLRRLEETGEILQKTTNKFRVITICKYGDYQIEENKKGKQRANKGQTKGNKQELKELNNNKSMDYRKHKFVSLLTPYLETYGRDLLNEFYEYWTEHGEADKKMRFEKQKSFSIERRLKNWKRNEKTFGNNRSSQKGFNSKESKQAIKSIFDGFE